MKKGRDGKGYNPRVRGEENGLWAFERIKFIYFIFNLNLNKIINSINGISYCQSRLSRSSLLRCPYPSSSE
jgi:hypothetical protein